MFLVVDFAYSGRFKFTVVRIPKNTISGVILVEKITQYVKLYFYCSLRSNRTPVCFFYTMTTLSNKS